MEARFVAGIFVGVSLTLAWAGRVYVADERAHRSSWIGAARSVGAQPYRSSSRADDVRAPGLVRAAAFLCLWLGQFMAAVMIVPAFFMRPISTSMNAAKPGSTVSAAMLVYTLGPTLLARHLLIEAHVIAARSLLHTIAGALALFGAFGLARGEWPSLFCTLLGIASIAILLSVLLSKVISAHGSAFRGDSDA